MKSFIKTQSGISAYDTTLRDLNEVEMCDIVARSGGTSDVLLRSFTTETGDAICVAALRACRKNLPVSYRFKGDDGKEYIFRGNVAVCGVKDGKPSDLQNLDELLNRYPVEPMYKDDAICIPSAAEWGMFPTGMRYDVTPSFWIWTRTRSTEEGVKIDEIRCTDAGGSALRKSADDSSGGVAPFIDLRRIPEETAAKMRELMGKETKVEVHAEGYNDIVLVKVTNDIYACASHSWNMCLDSSDLMPFDEDGGTEYEKSTLREYLNGEYLDDLIRFIEKVEILP